MSDPNGYDSHLPVLRMVLALMKPERVLELGAGVYSTPAFLECESLERLTSLETDKAWADRLWAEITDERLSLYLVEDMVEALPGGAWPGSLMDYDLILIDNADNAPERVRTIRAVLEKEHPVVIVHDAEHPWYRHTVNELAEHYVLFDEQVPHTAVVW